MIMTTAVARRFAGLTIAALIAAGLAVGPSLPMDGPADDVETSHCVASGQELRETAGLSAGELCEAMGGALSLARYEQLAGPVNDALELSDATTPERMAMWLAQVAHESGGLRYMVEQADGSQYEGRTDLGNTQPGDGTGSAAAVRSRSPAGMTSRSSRCGHTTAG